MNNQPVVGCIGAGYWGKNLVRVFHELGALATVCDADEAQLARLAAQYPGIATTTRVADVLADRSITAVAIATPAETHGHLVRAALEADKDVFVEKPLCLSETEGRELVALAKERKRILMVGHLLWYHPAVLKLKQLIDDGELGRIQYIYSNRLNLGKVRREENILWSFAPHDISVLLGLVGETPNEVHAHGANYLHDEIADVTITVLTFPSGVKAHIFVSWLHPFKEQKLIVVGDRQMAVFDDVEKTNKLMLYPHSIDWRNHSPVVTKAPGHAVAFEAEEPLRAECAHFLACVGDRTVPRTDGAEALRVLEVLRRCQASLDGSPTAAVQPAPPPAPDYFVHESSYVDEPSSIGRGTSIWHFSHVLKGSTIGANCKIGQNVVIGPNAVIGDGVKIQNNVSVYEGVVLEDGVFCGPSMVFTNVHNPRSEISRMNELRPTLVRRGASLGANCTIVCGSTIGAYAFVGAGSVVTRDVPDYALVVGSPARVIGWLCRCGHRIKFEGERGECSVCKAVYRNADGVVTPDREPELVTA